MRQGSFENRDKLILVARETASDEGCAEAEAERYRVNGGHAVLLAFFAPGSDVGGGGELALGESIDAVVFDDVDHAHVAANGVAHVAEADGERIAVAGNADVDE